jgi:6-phosphogluconolactonase (cycloisomerase 2 family)
MFQANPVSGQLLPLGEMPAGRQPIALDVDPSDRYVYVANGGSNSISGYRITNSNGSLTPLDGSPVPATVQPCAVVGVPLGRFVYVGNAGSQDIFGFTVDSSTGNLSPIHGSRLPVGANPCSLSIDPAGRFLYAATSEATARRFSLNGATGGLVPLS